MLNLQWKNCMLMKFLILALYVISEIYLDENQILQTYKIGSNHINKWLNLQSKLRPNSMNFNIKQLPRTWWALTLNANNKIWTRLQVLWRYQYTKGVLYHPSHTTLSNTILISKPWHPLNKLAHVRIDPLPLAHFQSKTTRRYSWLTLKGFLGVCRKDVGVP